MKKYKIIVLFLTVFAIATGQNFKDSISYEKEFKKIDSLYNGKILVSTYMNNAFDSLNINCVNSIAISEFNKRIKIIQKRLNKEGINGTIIDYYIGNFELLTSLESESDGNFFGRLSPTNKDICNWKNWLKKNKEYLCYYEKRNILYLKK